MSRIGYRRYTACLGLVVLLALSSCGKKPEDTAAGGSPSASSAPTTAASSPEASTPSTGASSPEAATSPSSTTASSSPGATSSSSSTAGVKPNGTVCPATAPIKGNISKKRGKIYFTTKFPDYKKVKPETCFADVAEAKSAGFRAPKAAK